MYIDPKGYDCPNCGSHVNSSEVNFSTGIFYCSSCDNTGRIPDPNSKEPFNPKKERIYRVAAPVVYLLIVVWFWLKVFELKSGEPYFYLTWFYQPVDLVTVTIAAILVTFGPIAILLTKRFKKKNN